MIHSNTDTRVGTAIIKQPTLIMVHKSFSKNYANRILSATLIISLGHKERLVQTIKQFCRVLAIEERLPCTIGISYIA